MRDGDFHLNVLKRLDDLEDGLDMVTSHLEEKVNTFEKKVEELEDQIHKLWQDVNRANDRIDDADSS